MSATNEPPHAWPDGTRNERIVGQRVSVTYPWHHERTKRTETRYAIGYVVKIFAGGDLLVKTDRDGEVRVLSCNVEACS